LWKVRNKNQCTRWTFSKLTSFVRIRIRIANADPDPGEQNQCEFLRIRKTGFHANEISVSDSEFQNTRCPVSLTGILFATKEAGGGRGMPKMYFRRNKVAAACAGRTSPPKLKKGKPCRKSEYKKRRIFLRYWTVFI
jgi:hypothetical protein